MQNSIKKRIFGFFLSFFLICGFSFAVDWEPGMLTPEQLEICVETGSYGDVTCEWSPDTPCLTCLFDCSGDCCNIEECGEQVYYDCGCHLDDPVEDTPLPEDDEGVDEGGDEQGDEEGDDNGGTDGGTTPGDETPEDTPAPGDETPDDELPDGGEIDTGSSIPIPTSPDANPLKPSNYYEGEGGGSMLLSNLECHNLGTWFLYSARPRQAFGRTLNSESLSTAYQSDSGHYSRYSYGSDLEIHFSSELESVGAAESEISSLLSGKQYGTGEWQGRPFFVTSNGEFIFQYANSVIIIKGIQQNEVAEIMGQFFDPYSREGRNCREGEVEEQGSTPGEDDSLGNLFGEGDDGTGESNQYSGSSSESYSQGCASALIFLPALAIALFARRRGN